MLNQQVRDGVTSLDSCESRLRASIAALKVVLEHMTFEVRVLKEKEQLLRLELHELSSETNCRICQTKVIMVDSSKLVSDRVTESAQEVSAYKMVTQLQRSELEILEESKTESENAKIENLRNMDRKCHEKRMELQLLSRGLSGMLTEILNVSRSKITVIPEQDQFNFCEFRFYLIQPFEDIYLNT
jgi:hypothetical protein